jgi:hypothetical protein
VVLERKAVAFAQILSRSVHPFVFGLDRGAAFAADQELPGVGMLWMVARNKGARAIQPMHQAGVH